jgi:hypothetical protein
LRNNELYLSVILTSSLGFSDCILALQREYAGLARLPKRPVQPESTTQLLDTSIARSFAAGNNIRPNLRKSLFMTIHKHPASACLGDRALPGLALLEIFIHIAPHFHEMSRFFLIWLTFVVNKYGLLDPIKKRSHNPAANTALTLYNVY